MKNYLLRYFAICALLIFGVNAAYSQDESNTDEDTNAGFDLTDPMQQVSQLAANLGLTNIDGQTYFGFRIQPELALGKLAFGMDVPLFFSSEGFRKDEYTGGVGILRLFRYVSWGQKKRDPLFIKVGDLTGSYLGYGMLVNNYTNAHSFEKRKVGLSFDVLIKKRFGIEGIYSDFNSQSFNMLAIRPYVRPMGGTDIPVLKTLDIGFSYVTDKDNTIMKITDSTSVSNNFVKSGMKAYGVDMGVHFINNKMVRLSGYLQYAALQKNKSSLLEDSLNTVAAALELGGDADQAKFIRDYKQGTGFSMGADLRVKLMENLLTLQVRCERLWYTNYFMPQFFDATYEMDKDARIASLSVAKEKKGIYGIISGNVIEKVSISGGLLIPDGVSEENPGVFQLALDANKLIPKVSIAATYLKGGITDFTFKEIFDLDQRSLAHARVGYQLKPWLVVGMDYKWTWERTDNGVFKAASQISPYFGLSLPLPFGNQKEESSSDDY